MSEIVPGFDARGHFLDALEYQILAGNVFGGQLFNPSLAKDGTIDALIRTGNLAVAMRVRIFAGGDGTAQSFTDPTYSAAGANISLTNRNSVKAAAKGAALTQISPPTLTDPGTPGSDLIFIPGGTGGNSTGGAQFQALAVLPPNAEVLVRTTNISGVASPFQLGFLFVEGKMSERAEDPQATSVFI